MYHDDDDEPANSKAAKSKKVKKQKAWKNCVYTFFISTCLPNLVKELLSLDSQKVFIIFNIILI